MSVVWHRSLYCYVLCKCVSSIVVAESKNDGQRKLISRNCLIPFTFAIRNENKYTNCEARDLARYQKKEKRNGATKNNWPDKGFELFLINLIVHIYFIYICSAVNETFLIYIVPTYGLKLCQIGFYFNWVTQYKKKRIGNIPEHI